MPWKDSPPRFHKLEILVPLVSRGLSPHDCRRIQALMHLALLHMAEAMESRTDWDCDYRIIRAMAAGLRGDGGPPMDS